MPFDYFDCGLLLDNCEHLFVAPYFTAIDITAIGIVIPYCFKHKIFPRLPTFNLS